MKNSSSKNEENKGECSSTPINNSIEATTPLATKDAHEKVALADYLSRPKMELFGMPQCSMLAL